MEKSKSAISIGNNVAYLRTIFFAYSLALMELILCQPFQDTTRFIIYCTIPLLGLIVICKTGLKGIVINAASILFLAVEIWTTILLFVHSEFMIYGLAAIINILIFFIGFYRITSEELLDEVDKVANILTYVTLFIVIISLLIKPVSTAFPKLFDITIFGKPTVFKEIAILSQSNYRLRGYAYHPNQTGMICSTGIMASFFVILHAPKKRDIILAVINVTLNVIFLVLASARSSFLSTIIFCGAFVVYYAVGIWKDRKENPTFKRLIIFLLVSIIVLVIILLVCAVSTDAKDYMEDRLLRVDSIKTANGRDNLQKTILKYYLESKRYLLGVSREDTLNLTERYGAHNSFVEMLAAKGFISFILLACSLIAPLIYSIKLLISKRKLSHIECLLMAFTFGAILATIAQNSYESAFLYELSGGAPFKRWACTISVIVWANHKLENKTK